MKNRCPKCCSENVRFSRKTSSSDCEDCQHVWNEEKPLVPRRLFISYGHDEHTSLAVRLRDDLRARGHDVWFDEERLKPGYDFEAFIEEGLEHLAADKANSAVMVLLTPHSVRRPDGYCLNEIARALGRGLRIIPLMVVDSEPPLSICCIQWLDMRPCIPIHEKEALYRPRFERLLKAIEENQLDFEGTQQRLIKALQPLEFDADILRHAQKFTGRQWVFDRVDAWLAEDPPKQRVFWISGGPGVGKTALSAVLSSRYLAVAALHLCKFGHTQKSDPRCVVMSVAYQLTTQLPEYETKLAASDIERLAQYDARTLFDNLLVQPLVTLNPPNRAIVILIDALDEATNGVRNELASFIAAEFPKTPSWLRLILTSRPEQPVTGPLQGLNPFILDTEIEANRTDICNFLHRELAPLLQGRQDANRIVKHILAASQGVFLYAERVCDDIERGNLSLGRLDEFPQGLGGVFWQFFERQFPDLEKFRKNVRPALRAILAAYEPLPLDILQCLLNCQEEELRELTHSLGSLFLVTQVDGVDVIRPYHKSLVEWLADQTKAGPYFISSQEGHKMLAGLGWREYESNVYTMCAYFLGHLVGHIVHIEQWDKLCALLCDLRFVEARCVRGQVFGLQADYRLALASLPELLAESQTRQAREARVERWTKEIINYAVAWAEWRDHSAKGECVNSPSVSLPENISSCAHWTDHEIEMECERIVQHPKRSEFLAGVASFVTAQYYPLFRYGKYQGFALQHAFNSEPSGPVHLAAAQLIRNRESPWIERLWPSATSYMPNPACLRIMEGHSGRVRGVDVTPDGRRTVSASLDRTLRIWDVENGACLKSLEGHSDLVSSVKMTPDGLRAISGSFDRTLRFWDLGSGECLRILEGSDGAILSLSVTPDGRRAVSASDDGTLRLWDLQRGACVGVLQGHSSAVNGVAVTPDGCRAVSASCDGTLRVWDLERCVCVRILEGHRAWVLSVSVTSNGRLAVSGSDDRTLRVWDLENGNCLQTLDGHNAGVLSVGVTADGHCAVSAAADRTLRVWDLKNGGTCIRTLEGHSHEVRSVSVTPDGRRAVSAGRDRSLRVWNLETGARVRRPGGHSLGVRSISTSPDGRRAVSASDDLTLRVWDAERTRCISTISGHRLAIRSVSMTSDGRRAVSGGLDRTLRLWDLDNGVCLQVCRGHSDGIFGVSVMPSGHRAVSASLDHTLRVWDLETGACLRVLHGHSDGVLSASLTHDGRLLVSCSSDGTVRVWELKTGMCLRTLRGHKNAVCSVNVTSDGRRAVSASFDRTLRFWDLEKGVCLRILEGHSDRILSVGLTPDNRYAVSASEDRVVAIWDVETGGCLLRHYSESSPFSAGLLSGAKLVYGTESGEVVFLKIHGVLGPAIW